MIRICNAINGLGFVLIMLCGIGFGLFLCAAPFWKLFLLAPKPPALALQIYAVVIGILTLFATSFGFWFATRTCTLMLEFGDEVRVRWLTHEGKYRYDQVKVVEFTDFKGSIRHMLPFSERILNVVFDDDCIARVSVQKEQEQDITRLLSSKKTESAFQRTRVD